MFIKLFTAFFFLYFFLSFFLSFFSYSQPIFFSFPFSILIHFFLSFFLSFFLLFVCLFLFFSSLLFSSLTLFSFWLLSFFCSTSIWLKEKQNYPLVFSPPLLSACRFVSLSNMASLCCLFRQWIWRNQKEQMESNYKSRYWNGNKNRTNKDLGKPITGEKNNCTDISWDKLEAFSMNQHGHDWVGEV